jgi:hypothetical protein
VEFKSSFYQVGDRDDQRAGMTLESDRGVEKRRAARWNIFVLSQVHDKAHDRLSLCDSCLPAGLNNRSV